MHLAPLVALAFTVVCSNFKNALAKRLDREKYLIFASLQIVQSRSKMAKASSKFLTHAQHFGAATAALGTDVVDECLAALAGVWAYSSWALEFRLQQF